MAERHVAVPGGSRAPDFGLARAELLALGGIVALGAWLRLRHLGLQSYWFDESVTVGIVNQPFARMIAAVAHSESTPPLYYGLAWGWTRAFGVSEAGLRSLSAVVGVGALPLVWAAGRRLVGPGAGVAAAGLCAVNPTLVWYSQEARSYALMAFLRALSFLLFVRAWERASAPRLCAWALAGALALTAHYFSAFLLLPEAALLLWRWRRSRRWPVAGAIAALGAIGAALVPLAHHQEASGRTAWIGASDLGDRVKQAGQELLSAGTHSVTTGTDPRSAWSVPALALLVGAAGMLRWRGDARERSGAGLAALVGAAAILVPLALTLTPLDFFQDRNLLAAWVPLLVAAGRVRRAPRRPVRNPRRRRPRGHGRVGRRPRGPRAGPPARGLARARPRPRVPVAVAGHQRAAELRPAGLRPVQRWQRGPLTLLRYRGAGPVTVTRPLLGQLAPLVVERRTRGGR